MLNLKSRILILSILSIFLKSESYAGGGMSKGMAKGIAGGVAFGVGAATGARTTFGVNINGAGRVTPNVSVRDKFGRYLANIDIDSDSDSDYYEPFRRGRDYSPPIREELPKNIIFDKSTEDINLAKDHLKGWRSTTEFGTKTINGQKYCCARDNNDEFLSLLVGQSWEKTSRTLIGTQRFENQPSNLTFEITPFKWYFEKVEIDGIRYDHAYSDTLCDFMVPEGKKQSIAAPDYFVKNYKLEQEKKRKAELEKAAKEKINQQIDENRNNLANSYFKDFIWTTLNTVRNIELKNETKAKKYVTSALGYFNKAIEVLKPIGYFVDTFLKEMLIPGGLKNLKKYSRGEISGIEYTTRVGNDLMQDVDAACIGAIIGGPGLRLAGAVVGGPVGALAGASIGSLSGAINGWISFRALRASTRASVSFPKERFGEKKRVKTVKEDADRYINELRLKKVLSEKRIAADGREYFEFLKKCEYNGIKFKKGEFLERDTMHHEWEYFHNKDIHRGAIDPITGSLKKDSNISGRTLKVK